MQLRSGKVCGQEVVSKKIVSVSKEPSTDKKVVDNTMMKTFEKETSMFLKRVNNLYEYLCGDELLRNINALSNFCRYIKRNIELVVKEQKCSLNVLKLIKVILKKTYILSKDYERLLHTQETDYYKNEKNIEDVRIMILCLIEARSKLWDMEYKCEKN
jgi:hypothetical protein